MDVLDISQILFRWIHIIFGIIWIGLLYFFNFVNIPFQATIDAGNKQKVNPELLSRVLFWFRWGAAWTWVTGFLLLGVVYYSGGVMFENGFGWSAGSGILVLLTFGSVFIYDALAKQFGKEPKVFGTIGFVLIVVMVLLFTYVGEFSYRSMVIHTGAMFGSIMAYNVWFKIWPAQKITLPLVKAGQPTDAALMATASQRSRHNTYLSVPLFYTMINAHTVSFSGSLFGIDKALGYTVLFVAILLGWHVVFQFYKKSAKIQSL